MLYPRPANKPITRARTPGSLSTNTAMVCLSVCACGCPDGIAEPHSILFIALTLAFDHRCRDDVRTVRQTITLPVSETSNEMSSLADSSPKSMLLCASPDGIIGKQLASL